MARARKTRGPWSGQSQELRERIAGGDVQCSFLFNPENGSRYVYCQEIQATPEGSDCQYSDIGL